MLRQIKAVPHVFFSFLGSLTQANDRQGFPPDSISFYAASMRMREDVTSARLGNETVNRPLLWTALDF